MILEGCFSCDIMQKYRKNQMTMMNPKDCEGDAGKPDAICLPGKR